MATLDCGGREIPLKFESIMIGTKRKSRAAARGKKKTL